MLTDSTEPRKVGRPIVVPDEKIFQAVYHVLSKGGPRRVTLAAVANELDITSPALIKRFQSRHGLMLAFSRWAVANSQNEFRSRHDYSGSALKALRIAMLTTTNNASHGASNMREYANIVRFYFDEALDPEIRSLWGEWTEAYEQETIRYLNEAVDTGELRENCNPEKLGQALHSALTGMVVLWSGHAAHSYQQRLDEIFDTIINPHLRS